MKRTKLFLLTQLTAFALSLFSCSNLLTEVNSPKDIQNTNVTGTVTGRFTYNGAIPQELLPSQNSNNGKTAFASAVPSNYNFTVQATASGETSVSGYVTTNKTAYVLSGLTLDKEYTITITATKTISGNTVTVFQGSDTVTLTSTSPMVDKNITLNAIQTLDNKTGTVNLKVTVPDDSYVLESSFNRFTCSQDSEDRKVWIITINETYSGQLNSESYNTTFNLYSDYSKATLLYSFAETINIFDGLETNTWVKNSTSNGDAHLTLQEEQSYIADCIITPELISKFQSTTLYVDSTASNSTENGTFDNPYKTLQAVVDNIITYGNTTDKYTIYIKNDIDFVSRILFIQTGQEIRNITIAGYDGVKTIKRTSDCILTLFEFSIESYNITLRDLILDGNDKNTDVNGSAIRNSSNLTLENVTIQKFISHRNSTDSASAGGAIYNGGTLTLKKSKILNCTSKNDSGSAYGGAIYNGNSKTLILDDVVISGCKTQADTASKESFGGGIYNAGTCNIKKAIITGCKTTSATEDNAKGGAIYNTGSLTLGDSICNSDGSPDVTIGIGSYNGTNYSTPNEAFSGAGVFSGASGTTASFTMNKDCVIGKYNPDSAPTEEIYGNRSCSTSKLGNGGAGVWISTYNRTMTIKGGFISYNYAENTSGDPGSTIPIKGVGLCFNANKANTEINNLVISYNKAYIANSLYSAVEGIGLWADKSVTLNNVKIENNSYETSSTTQVKGKGLYSNQISTVTLKGTTYFGTDDDIYLYYEKSSYFGKITVDSILNPQNTFGVPQQYVATITPGSYTDGLQVINGTKVGTEYKKFTVTQKSDSSEYWHIKNTGYLSNKIGTKEKTETLKVGDIVFIDGSSKPYSEGLDLSEEEKNTAIAVIFREGTGTDGDKTLGVGIIHGSTIRFASTAKGCKTYFEDTVCDKNAGSTNGNLSFTNSPNTDGSKNLKKMIDKLGSNNDTGVVCNEDGSIDFEHSDQTTLAKNYPVFEFAYYYGKNNGHNIKSGSEYETGWYLPSASELNDMYLVNKNENIIQKALQATTGINIERNNYISSSQESDNSYRDCLKGFVFDMGSTNFLGKKTNDPRPVCAIRAFD